MGSERIRMIWIAARWVFVTFMLACALAAAWGRDYSLGCWFFLLAIWIDKDLNPPKVRVTINFRDVPPGCVISTREDAE